MKKKPSPVVSKKCLKKLHKLKFVTVSLKPGTKDPFLFGWNTVATSDPIGVDNNIGLKHMFSRTCVIDADDLKALKKTKLRKHIKRCPGIRYTSGKKNRMKYLYRTPKGVRGFVTVQLPKGVKGSINSAWKTGNSAQDVLPPSRLADGREYYWIDKLPKKRSGIPRLPKKVWKYVRKTLSDLESKRLASATGGSAVAKSTCAWVNAFNEWFVESGQSLDAWIEEHTDYIRTPAGWKHPDSTSTNNIILKGDDTWALNFSDPARPRGNTDRATIDPDKNWCALYEATP